MSPGLLQHLKTERASTVSRDWVGRAARQMLRGAWCMGTRLVISWNASLRSVRDWSSALAPY